MRIWIGATAALAFAVAALAPVVAQDEASAPAERYWRLKGGGEIVGRPAKETPDAVYIDIGPRIIEVPADSIVASESIAEAAEKGQASQMAKGSGVFDPETGSVVFSARQAGEELLTQAEMVERAKKSVVLILNPRGSAGSGWVLDRTGRIVTNHHVIRGEQYHTVNLFVKRGDQWERIKIENAEVEAFSSYYDIAIIKIDPDKAAEKGVELVPLPIADPASVEVGDKVYAIGNPGLQFGKSRLLEHSVSEGIISSGARNYFDVLYIQTTAAINPGNSGGPLINDRGEVVGLVTLGASFQEGLGFGLTTGLIRHFLDNSRSFAYSDMSDNKGFRYLSPE